VGNAWTTRERETYETPIEKHGRRSAVGPTTSRKSKRKKKKKKGSRIRLPRIGGINVETQGNTMWVKRRSEGKGGKVASKPSNPP